MLEKWPFLEQKPWFIPFGKMSIFRLFELSVFIAQKGVFWFQNIVKDILLAYNALKRILERWPFLDQKPRVIHFGKMSIFRRFELFAFIAQKGVFSFQNIIKKISWPIVPKKEFWKDGHFRTKNHGLTPFEKCQFFDVLNFLFLQPRKALFHCKIS